MPIGAPKAHAVLRANQRNLKRFLSKVCILALPLRGAASSAPTADCVGLAMRGCERLSLARNGSGLLLQGIRSVGNPA